MYNNILPMMLGILIMLFSGYFSVSLIDRELELRFRILFAIPLGIALNSIFYFLYQCAGFYNFSNYKLFECIVVLILALMYYNQERPDLSKHKYHRLNNWFYVLNVYALSIFFKYFINNPMGSWDGFRIWNTKAEYLFLQSPQWKQLFSLPHFMSHGDYPLLLPSSTARLWQYAGGENYFLNAVLGLFFTFTIVYLLYQTTRYFKSEKVANIVCSILVIADIFMVNGAAQCADIPLALFFLSAISCLFLYFKSKRFSTMLLGMIFAGLSVWVKNEGLMFFGIYASVVIGYFISQRDWKKSIVSFISALPFGVMAVLFKKYTDVPNDLVYGVILEKSYSFLCDWHRYLVVVKSFISMMLHQFVLFLALIILCVKGFKIKEKFKVPTVMSLIILTLMSIGYVIVYVISPHDINWLVDNSMDRIILQILPVFLFIFSTTLRIGKPDTLN